jgi:hypothetical protein
MITQRRGYRRFLFVAVLVLLFIYWRSSSTSKQGPLADSHYIQPAESPISDEGIPLVRAVITHHSFRTTWQMKYLDQLKMFHRSWVEMLKTQKPHWRTDFVIIAEKTLPLFGHMNCSTVLRKNRTQSMRTIEDILYIDSLFFSFFYIDSNLMRSLQLLCDHRF